MNASGQGWMKNGFYFVVDDVDEGYLDTDADG